MTAPREILPGRTYLVTRRCTQRQYLLTPSALTNQVIGYSLAVAANQTGVLLHAYCFMSNHWHGVLTDPEGRLPEFLERFHRLLARAMNRVLRRRENFWSSEKPSVVWLVSAQDVARAIAYTIANPTAAGLVESPDEWPGVITRSLGETSLFDMPAVFFDQNGGLPPRAELRSHRIDSAVRDNAALGLRLRAALRSLVQRAHLAMHSAGRGFVGAPAVLRQSVLGVPASIEAKRTIAPKVAAENRDVRRWALGQVRSFLVAYRRAWGAWRTGMRDIVFPPGTYALRVNAGVLCESPIPLSA